MTKSIEPQPGIAEIKLYKGGDSKIDGREDVLKLSSNENPFGAPQSARDAFEAAALSLHRYPSTDHAKLRAAIAETHGLDADRIICGAGSDEVITFLCQAYAGPGDEVIHTSHGFSMYRISTLAAGATPVEVAEKERCVDVDAILAGVTDKTRLVFIANPANPTATMIGDNEVTRLADALPPHVLLVLDGAYAEYVEGFDGGAALVDARDNVVMTRTFSKIYGLGGLRIGWGYGPAHVIDTLLRVRGPFNLSDAQLDAATAAVRDTDWVKTCQGENARMRSVLTKRLADFGVPCDASSANFVLARFDDEETAQGCEAKLRSDGILVRLVGGYGLPNCLRITVGSEEDCARVIASVGAFQRGET
ncbi:MAG: histidinol-phosphate transaminase [Paracoccaceae bacterium]